MKAETRAFIDELIRQKQYKKDNGPIEITADQLWPYSGKIEENSEEYDTYLRIQDEPSLNAMQFARYYKRRIKEKNIYLLLSPGEAAIIDCFYDNCNKLTFEQIAAKTGRGKEYVKKVIEKHLKIQQNDKKNTSGRSESGYKFDW